MRLAFVEVVTTSHVVVGKCATPRGAARLIDLLNQESHLLTVADWNARSLRQSTDLVASGTTCFIPKDRIVWARPVEFASEAEEEWRVAERDRISKIRQPVVVLAPPFHITGNAHFPEAADATQALARLVLGFLPLTEARVVMECDDGFSSYAEVIVLNGRMADIVTLESTGQLARLASDATDAS